MADEARNTRDEAGQPAALSLDVLGPVRLRREDIDVPLTTLERTLLAALAVSRPRVVSVESLVEWMWGGSEHASSRNRVQAVVSGVRRKAAPSHVIETHEMGYRLHPGVTTDLTRRDRLMEAAHESGPDRRQHREHLHAAHALPTGVCLHGCRPTPGLDGMRRRLDDVGLEIQAERIEADVEDGVIEGLATELAGLTERHPYHEHFHALLMRVLVRVGRQADALATYRLMLQRLDDELGVRPGPLLNAALEEVLRFSDAASGRPLDSQASPAEPSGSVAHKDPSRYADVLSTPRTAPRSVSVLIGRDVEMDAVLREARGPTADNERGPAPLIAITGLGGMGKSALAIEAAHRLHDDFADGTLYLHLGTETGRAGVPAILGHFLSLLGISAEACPPGLDARVALFRSVLDDRRVLVVLDDVPADVDLTYVLPTRAPCAAILTSRSALDDYDPTLRVPLRSLGVGAAQGLFEAQLDPARVSSHSSALATLAAQCHGLPLLLRVTAQRVAARPDLSLAEASRGLALASTGSDADPMRAAVTACLGLAQAPLDPLSRTVLSRFAALPFRGASHWLLTALVSDQPNAAVAASSAVAQLQAASLLDPVARDGVGTQYEVHDLVRLNAGSTGEADRDRDLSRVALTLLDLLHHYATRYPARLLPVPPDRDGQRTPSEVAETEPEDALRFFRTEQATVLTCAKELAGREVDVSWRLLVLLARQSQTGLEPDLWLGAADQVRAHLDDQVPDDRRGVAYLALAEAFIRHEMSDSRVAADLVGHASLSLQMEGDCAGALAAAVVLGRAHRALGQREQAEEALAWAERACSDVPDPLIAGYVELAWGSLLDDYDELVSARERLRRAVALLEPHTDWSGTATAQFALARVHRRLGELDEGLPLCDRAMDLFARLGDVGGRMAVLDTRADLLVLMGEPHQALDAAQQAVDLATRHRHAFILHRAQRTRGRVHARLGYLIEAEKDLRASIDGFELIDRPLSLAASLRDLGKVLQQRGDPAGAKRVFLQERDWCLRSGLTDVTELDAIIQDLEHWPVQDPTVV